MVEPSISLHFLCHLPVISWDVAAGRSRSSGLGLRVCLLILGFAAGIQTLGGTIAQLCSDSNPKIHPWGLYLSNPVT